MKYSLRTKLTLSYVLIILISVGLLSILSNVLLQRLFEGYVIERQEQETKEIISIISRQYEEDKKWENKFIEHIGMKALEDGLILKVFDINDQIIWDATVHNNGLCEEMLHNVTLNMESYYKNWQGGYVEKKYSITSNKIKIGTIVVGYIGPFYFNNDDLYFINTLNKAIILIGILSLLAAFIVGTIMSKKLSKPITAVIKKAHFLSKGNYDYEIVEKSNTKEIIMLTETMNNLSDALKNQEMLRKRLTQDVAHELRTPLTSVQGHLEAMIDGIWEPSNDRLQSCYDELLRIKRLISSMENLIRIEGENIKLKKEAFNVSNLVEGILKNYENEFIKKKIKIHFSKNNVILNADKDKIIQVFVNLISNSLRYTESGGNIFIGIEEVKNKVKIEVSDSGIGIDETKLDNIFERFYRTDKSRNKYTGGTGIGLTIVKTIINAHNGKIEVNSQKDVGTTFIIYLPKQNLKHSI